MDYLAVARCYRCQAYGHLQRYCTEKTDQICSHCGNSGRSYPDCVKREQARVVCIVRRTAKKSCSHRCRTRACPLYLKALERKIALNTNMEIATQIDSESRVGQINVMGSSICLEELNLVIRDRCLEVVLLQEPYSCGGRLPYLFGYRVNYKLERSKASIVIINERNEGLFVRQLSLIHIQMCIRDRNN